MILSLPPPPRHALRVRSDDPDEVSAWSASHAGYHSRVVHEPGPYGFEVATLGTQTPLMAWARNGLRQTIRGCVGFPVLHVPLGTTHVYRHGRRRIDAEPGSLAYVPAGQDFTRHCEAGAIFSARLDEGALLEELRTIGLDDAPSPPGFAANLQASERSSREFAEALAGLIRALDPQSPAGLAAHANANLVAAVAVLLAPPSAGRGGGTSVAVRRVAYVEAWIDAHLGEAITMGRLCTATGVSARSLQLAFQRRHGMSPMRYLFERRLAAAHRRIVGGDGREDVTGIATGLGFTHLGRFAVAYREAYGESPSQTLRRHASRLASAGGTRPAWSRATNGSISSGGSG